MKHVLVTGATGKIGSLLIERLSACNNVTIRAFVRNAEKAKPLITRGVELIQGTFEDTRAVRAAVDGIDLIVLITSANPNAADQAHNMLVAARKAGVKKVVRISVFKASVDGPTDITRLHGRTDGEIKSSGFTYTILRPLFFMQNLFFFFQAEDGIRDLYVTGVQTCALPISRRFAGARWPAGCAGWLSNRR